MAFDPRNVKYPLDLHHPQNMSPYPYPSHHVIQSMHRMDENRNENQCSNKELCPAISHQSSGTQTIQKVDVATMTDPLQIDFRLTSEYLERCSTSLGRLPYVCKYKDSSSNSSGRSCQDIHPKIEYDLPEPQRINGMLIYHCPECAYRFEDRETLQDHLDDHKKRPYVCDICGVKLRRKEHVIRHSSSCHDVKRPYQCSTCCKSFKRNEHLLRHFLTHSGQKTEVCTECGKAFYRKDHLKKHLKSHVAKRAKESDSFAANSSDVQTQQQVAAQQEGLSTFTMMMRQAGPPPFSVMRT
ncbi:zinc finger protein 436 [Copidosoma floridanum]|uniref:zinc finger protein 436 n=1 Tax=Copidosoma floridanum TaxID=29053 RepID=UPI0006C9A481|nr:zinc finger protein 436 [Copidosoma floridanum]XP_014209450.1 zinc finger protein 436 [Copidosoma floridanum]